MPAQNHPRLDLPADAATAGVIARVVEVHGGLATWNRVARIDGVLTTHGAAFAMRGLKPPIANTRFSVFPHERRTVLLDWPAAGDRAEWQGDDVRIERAGSDERRVGARAHCSGRARWDALDFTYFVGYAAWNYLSFPYLLTLDGVAARVVGRGQRLEVDFPAEITTHSRRQYFHLTEEGRLRRHDYVAEVFGMWASAANHCETSTVVEGLRFYTDRSVTPALGRHLSLPFPLLVDIRIRDLAVTFIS